MIYHSWYEQGFAYHPDLQIILGSRSVKKANLLVFENMAKPEQRNCMVQFGETERNILTFLVCESLCTLLVSYSNKVVIQYDLSDGKSFTKIQKRYTDIGNFYSCTRIGRFAIFGGASGKLVVIDISKRETVGRPKTTALKSIWSLRSLTISEDLVYLMASGTSPDYDGVKTDVFDVSRLLK